MPNRPSNKVLDIWGLQIHSGFTFTYPNSIGTLWAYLSTKEDIFKHLNLTGIGCIVQDTVLEMMDEIESVGVPDIILVTLYNWNKSRSIKLLREVKRKYPHVIVIAGGNEIPEKRIRLEKFVKDYPFFDYIVFKEGEIALEMILRKILSEKQIYYSEYHSDCYNQINYDQVEKFQTKFRFLDHKDFLDIPSPFTMGLFDDVYEKHSNIHLQAVLETNRGCPYTCTFCDWGLQEKLRKFNINRVQEEIDWMIGKADEVFIADANFGILNRDLEIAKYFIKAKIEHPNPRTHSLVFSHAKNNKEKVLQISELLEKFDLSRSGATFALQSMNPDTLKAIRRENLSITTDFDWIVSKFIDHGIPYTNELILGLPLETKESFFESLNTLLEYNPLSMNTFRLQYLENSEISYDNHSNKYGMTWSKFAQTTSNYEDEKEIAYLVRSTETMPRDTFDYVRLIRDMLEVFWMGKIAYYVGRYLQKSHNVGACDFMEAINDYFEKNCPDWWHQWIISKEDLRDPEVIVPLYYDYDKFKFHRFVNGWLFLTYVPENRSFFYNELKKICKVYYPQIDKGIIDDLINFNENFIVRSDMNYTNSFKSKYNWIHYFMFGNLKKEKTFYNLKINSAGHSKTALSEGKEMVRYRMAGGHDFLFNKQNAFVYHEGTYKAETSSMHWINKLGLFYESREFNKTAHKILENILAELPDVDKNTALTKFLHYNADYNEIIDKSNL